MTGFVFTFSLLCTAALQADPAILQRPEMGILRPFLEAAMPVVQQLPIVSRERHLHPVSGRKRGIPADDDAGYRRAAAPVEYKVPQFRPGRLRPIRGPTVAHTV